MNYNLHYDIAAIILVFVLIIHFYHKKAIRSNQTYVFIICLWLAMFTGVLDVITVLIDWWRLSPVVVYTANLVYLTVFNLLPPMYHMYLRLATKRYKDWTKVDKILLVLPITVSLLLIWTSPLTKLIFYYNVEEGYCHGPLFSVLYGLSVAYMVGTVTVMVYHKNVLTEWQRLSVVFYTGSSLIGIFLKLAFPEVLTMQFVASLSLLLLYMSLENVENDENQLLGIYNRRGFDKKVTTIVPMEVSFHVLVIHIANFQAIREMAGVEFSQSMLKRMTDMWNPAEKHADLYYVSEGKFAILADSKCKKFDEIVREVKVKAGNTIKLGDMSIQPDIILLQLDYPNEVKSVEDIMDSIDYSIDVPVDSFGEVLHLSGEILRNRRREGHILQIMQQALINKKFQVYYQPIYSTASGHYSSAEALIRLYDEGMGFISPEEFIPMAEKNGMILKIGEFVFRTVCEMMARERIWEKGIEYVEVNLSVVQCMQEDICEMLYGIMDEYGVPYNAINLEVTETTLARDILWATMERMSVGGVTFSLDDYGTGYSNLTNVLKHPFHIIKLDKSMIWYAMENEHAMKALRYTVEMMRDLGMHIVAEGVETEKQMRVLTEIGCEYLQGYYFSKPVPEKEFLDKVKM